MVDTTTASFSKAEVTAVHLVLLEHAVAVYRERAKAHHATVTSPVAEAVQLAAAAHERDLASALAKFTTMLDEWRAVT